MDKRFAFWDNYKGLLIFLVVFGHFIYSYATKCQDSWADTLFTFIYIFHMPAFIFVSGYFSKSDNSKSSKSLLKLFIYYIVFNFGMMLFLKFYNGTSMNLLEPYNSYWFILSLIFWRKFIPSLANIKGILPLSIIISLLMGFWNFPNILSIRRTIAFFPFFLMGYKFEKEKFDKLLSKRTIKISLISFVLVIAICLALIVILDNYNPLTLSMLLMGKYKSNYDIIYRIIIFIISVVAIMSLLFTVFKRQIPFLTKLGRNSLLVYLIHRFITIIFYNNIFPASEYSGIFIIYSFIATIVVCIIFSADKLNNLVNAFFSKIVNLIEATKIAKVVLVLVFIALLSLKPLETAFNNIKELFVNDHNTTEFNGQINIF